MFKFFKKDDLKDVLEEMLNVTKINNDPLSCYKELSNMAEDFSAKLFQQTKNLTSYSDKNYAFVVTKDNRESLFLITYNQPENFDPKFLENFNISSCEGVNAKCPIYIDSDFFPLHFFNRTKTNVSALKVLCHVHEYRYTNGSYDHLENTNFCDFLKYGDGALFDELKKSGDQYFPMCQFKNIEDYRSINRSLSKKIIGLSKELVREGLSKS